MCVCVCVCVCRRVVCVYVLISVLTSGLYFSDNDYLFRLNRSD